MDLAAPQQAPLRGPPSHLPPQQQQKQQQQQTKQKHSNGPQQAKRPNVRLNMLNGAQQRSRLHCLQFGGAGSSSGQSGPRLAATSCAAFSHGPRFDPWRPGRPDRPAGRPAEEEEEEEGLDFMVAALRAEGGEEPPAPAAAKGAVDRAAAVQSNSAAAREHLRQQREAAAAAERGPHLAKARAALMV